MKFSDASMNNLAGCDDRLIKLFTDVLDSGYDCAVICGYRTKEDQDKAFLEGKSKLQFPKSKHNISPSRAVDVVPFPIDWTDTKRFFHFAGYVKAIADRLQIKVRWGGDWDGDMNFREEKFQDLPHWELVD